VLLPLQKSPLAVAWRHAILARFRGAQAVGPTGPESRGAVVKPITTGNMKFWEIQAFG
jgi:hypothetical protein